MGHPQLHDNSIAAPQSLAMDDAVAAPVTMDHLVVVDDVLAAPITTSSCRKQRPPLDVDDAFAALINTPSTSCGIAPQHLLASHQLSIMTMASHHRRRNRTDPSDGIAPPYIFLAASHRVSL